MDDAALQRFAILLMLFGGFLELSGGVRGNDMGIYGFGSWIMLLALGIGAVALRSPERD